jgi:hypothetical protein
MKHALRTAAVFTLLGLARPASAQPSRSPWMPSLGGGQIDWHDTGLSTSVRGGSGATAIVMRGSRNLIGRVIGFEWGGAYAAFKEENRLDQTQTIALDWRLLLHTPWIPVQPFVGAGPSLFMYGTNSRGRDKFEGGYNVGGGVRVQATPGLFVIIDARLRGWDFGGADQLTREEADEITLSLGFRR